MAQGRDRDLSYGYGVSVTAIQLAHAYATLANNGQVLPLSMTRVDRKPVGGARWCRKTWPRPWACCSGWSRRRVAYSAPRCRATYVSGKSGTARKASVGTKGYTANAYRSMFAGFAPSAGPASP